MESDQDELTELPDQFQYTFTYGNVNLIFIDHFPGLRSNLFPKPMTATYFALENGLGCTRHRFRVHRTPASHRGNAGITRTRLSHRNTEPIRLERS